MYERVVSFINSKLKGVFQGTLPDQFKTKPLFLEPSIDNEAVFNDIYFFLVKSNLNTLIRTKSGGIKKGPKYLTNTYAWDYQKSSIGIMITICLGGLTYCIKYGNHKGKHAPEIYPNEAFRIFDEKCLEYGINLNKYKISNGQEVKAEIESPLISMEYIHTEEDEGLDNVHHLDFHNSYPAGLANKYPEFRPVIEYFYDKRKEDPVNKAVLNYTIGWMQSWAPDKGRFANWAHLSKAAISDNNRRILMKAIELQASGREIIGYNTDGIWYRGEVYHGPGEGSKLGEWENDHVNCKFRAKSAGAYEFIENGKYYAVVRGSTGLDAIKDRNDWAWGDIYKTGVKYFYFNEEKGVYSDEV
jgi:hypothetical protein